MSINIKNIGKESLKGKRVTLAPASLQYADFLAKTYQLDEFMDCYRMAQDRNVTAEQIRERLENEKDFTAQQLKRIEWIILDDEALPIGIASLADYQPAHNRAELLIGINQPEDRKGSLGVEATLLVMEFAFHKAQLHKLISFVYSFNEIAQKNTLHLGFEQEAHLRDHYFNHREKKYIDLYQNGLLSEDFYANKSLARWSKRLLSRNITVKSSQPKMRSLSKNELDKGLKTILSNAKAQKTI